jgi:hypothetical protein
MIHKSEGSMRQDCKLGINYISAAEDQEWWIVLDVSLILLVSIMNKVLSIINRDLMLDGSTGSGTGGGRQVQCM